LFVFQNKDLCYDILKLGQLDDGQNVTRLEASELFEEVMKTILIPKIPWDQKLVDCCLGNLCKEKNIFLLDK
jgi:hypothetical protein